MEPTKYIWFDGEMVPWADANVHVLSHALHYGTGVFEGIRAYAYESSGEILATIAGQGKEGPLVAAGEFGKGRVVVIATYTRPTSYAGHNVTPARASDPAHHNHEYDLSLVGRALIWAARKESGWYVAMIAGIVTFAAAFLAFVDRYNVPSGQEWLRGAMLSAVFIAILVIPWFRKRIYGEA